MSQPATAQIALSFPLIPGQVNPLPGIGWTFPFTWTASLPAATIPISGAGTYVVSLTMLPSTGCQALAVAVDTVDTLGGSVTTPVQLTFTGGFLWIPPGGGFLVCAPGILANGITALSIVTTAAARVHVAAMG